MSLSLNDVNVLPFVQSVPISKVLKTGFLKALKMQNGMCPYVNIVWNVFVSQIYEELFGMNSHRYIHNPVED